MKPILPTLTYAALATVTPFAAPLTAAAPSGKVVVGYQTDALRSSVAIANGNQDRGLEGGTGRWFRGSGGGQNADTIREVFGVEVHGE